jgi:hypothetical protein
MLGVASNRFLGTPSTFSAALVSSANQTVAFSATYESPTGTAVLTPTSSATHTPPSSAAPPSFLTTLRLSL